MSVKLVLNATPIINFNDRIKRPDLLLKFLDYGYTLNTTAEVLQEISKGRSINFLKVCITNGQIKLLTTDKNDFEQLKSSYPFLGDGELATICLGSQTNESDQVYCILDDKKAVQVAKELRITVKGSVGLLEELMKKQVISNNEFETLIEKMTAKGFFLKKSDLNL